jgi:murein DD-endopeptidase MepM/ murein hydrolase activator NlpD
MCKELRTSGITIRLAILGAAALALTGCSETTRFSNDPFSDPFKNQAREGRYDRTPTGTVNQPASSQGGGFSEMFRTFDDRPSPPERVPQDNWRPAPAPRPVAVESRPLTAPAPAPVAVAPVYIPPAAHVATQPAAPAAPRPVAAAPRPERMVRGSVGGWQLEGGTPVVVAQGETAAMIAQRYGVPTETLLSVNGYASRAQVQPGSRLTIPVYRANNARTASAEPAPAVEAPVAPAPARPQRQVRAEAPAAAPAPKYVLAKPAAPEKPAKPALSAKPAVTAQTEAAKAAADKRLRLAQVAAQEEARKIEADKRAHAKVKVEAPKTVAETRPAKQEKREVAAAAPVQPVAPKKVEAPVESTASVAPVAAAAPDSANPEFRWPARGRVIQAFGAGGNDGINIAVPEGTQVKAAESGVVAYAGSELKGYGNLVLIRHPNGFVSAYANNGSINVKRGDSVKRGQTIALSGQTGNVASPQLHFELRKGSKPVDPSSFLAGL